MFISDLRAPSRSSQALEQDISHLLTYFESTPSLWILILSGSGKAFCAGQDLKEWLSKQPNVSSKPTTSSSSNGVAIPLQDDVSNQAMQSKILHRGGFASLSTHHSTKPIILAVDGLCLGGGMETLLNMDLVVSSSRARFALPESLRGVVAAQGGIPRLVATVGRQRASDILFTGRMISAKEMVEIGLVNRVVDVAQGMNPNRGQKLVLREAIKLARAILQASPDAIRVTKNALRLAREGERGIDISTVESVKSLESKALYAGENLREGLEAFKEKRKPRWRDPVRAKL